MNNQVLVAGKETGSVMNHLMSRNDSKPIVGLGATILGWTDRHAYEVIEVSADSKRVIVQQYQPQRTDTNGMSECQEYKYEKLNESQEVIVWKWGSWKKETKNIMFTEAYGKIIGPDFWKSEDYKVLYPNDSRILALIPGKTEIKTEYSKVSILWGIKDEYHDYSF